MKADGHNYWWLNTDPNVWKLDDRKEGDIEFEKIHNAKGGKRMVAGNFMAVRPGDLIIGYETTPTKKVAAIYEVTKGVHEHENEEVFGFKILKILRKQDQISWKEIKNNPHLKNSKPVEIGNRFSLFELTPEEFHIIKNLVKV